WSMNQVKFFRDAIGHRSRLLLTTRDGTLVTGLRAEDVFVDVLSPEDASDLLAECSDQSRASLSDDAREVAEECGNLPLALVVCGAMAHNGTPWADLLDALRKAEL